MNQENENIVRLFVENRAEELIVEGIFADYVRDKRLKVKMAWTSSSAISLAEYWLLTTSSDSVALVLNCPGNADEFRVPIENILSRASTAERWHVSLAIPDMTTWLRLDPMFGKAIETNSVPQNSKADIAVCFKNWATGHRFDRETASQQNPEFAALNTFLSERVLSATAAAE